MGKGKEAVEYKIGLRTLGLLTILFLLGAVPAFAQDTLSGKYEGTLKAAGAAEEKLSLELKNEGAKVSGRLMRGTATLEATEGSLKDGMLSLGFGKDYRLLAKVDGDKLIGDWSADGHKHPIELMKVTTAAAAAIDINGDWEGLADANGQSFPFLLTLKVDGENVTGGSSSQLGEATVKAGTWKNGQLVFDLEGPSGVISMTAKIVEGKLSGDFDFSGQLQGRWVAIKKK